METRQAVVDFVKRCQRKLCSYDIFGIDIENTGLKDLTTQEELDKRKPPCMCDCKYGATNIGNAGEAGNGCPEMRCVVSIIDNMTDKEFERIRKRIYKRAVKHQKRIFETLV